MSVGGRIIEIKDVIRGDAGEVSTRLWCVDRDGDELCVYVERCPEMPKLGDEIWWQRRKVFFDNDRHHLVKVGYSFRPPTRELV